VVFVKFAAVAIYLQTIGVVSRIRNGQVNLKFHFFFANHIVWKKLI